jgi:hypothetical protein
MDSSLPVGADEKGDHQQNKRGGAPGLDGVQSSALKLVILARKKGGGEEAGGPDAAISFLTNLLNAILLSPVLPATLSKAELVYFYKKGDPLDLQNYRGIALQSVIYKMAASHTARRIQEASDTLSLLHPSQGAARTGSHAGIQAANIVSLISHARPKGQELHLTFCDVAKAFDSVPQEAFSEAMLPHGFPPDIVRRLEVLQACGEAVTRTPYGSSHVTTPITIGCNQGCPLSPIKFCIFINMFYTWLTATSSAGYAPTSPCDARGEAPPLISAQGFMDDTTFIASTREQSSEQFGKLNAFLGAYGMVVNPGKSALMEVTGVVPRPPPPIGQQPGQRVVHTAAPIPGSPVMATGEPGAAGAPALGLVHSSEYLPPELMPSLAACIGADIAVLTRDMATGDIKQRPHVYLARPAEGKGAVVQVPLHWRLLAGRLGQQSRAPGSGDIPVAPLRVVMFDGRFDAASEQHKGHYTAILPEQQCHLDRRDGNKRGGARPPRHRCCHGRGGRPPALPADGH